jgi:hypothetical protein
MELQELTIIRELSVPRELTGSNFPVSVESNGQLFINLAGKSLSETKKILEQLNNIFPPAGSLRNMPLFFPQCPPVITASAGIVFHYRKFSEAVYNSSSGHQFRVKVRREYYEGTANFQQITYPKNAGGHQAICILRREDWLPFCYYLFSGKNWNV